MAFTIPIAEFAAKAKANMETVVRKTTYEAFASVIAKSPVDSGRFRANWNVSSQAIDTSTSESTDAGRAQGEINKALSLPVGGVTYIANSLPYARTLEYGLYPNPPKSGTGKTSGGFSIQAPQGMVRLTQAEFNDFIQKALAQ